MPLSKTWRWVAIIIILILAAVIGYMLYNDYNNKSRPVPASITESFEDKFTNAKYYHVDLMIKKADIQAQIRETDNPNAVITNQKMLYIWNKHKSSVLEVINAKLNAVNLAQNDKDEPGSVIGFRVANNNDIGFVDKLLSTSGLYYYFSLPAISLSDNKGVNYAFTLGRDGTDDASILAFDYSQITNLSQSNRDDANYGRYLDEVTIANAKKEYVRRVGDESNPDMVIGETRETGLPGFEKRRRTLTNFKSYGQKLLTRKGDDGRVTASNDVDTPAYPFLNIHLILKATLDKKQLRQALLEANLLQPFIFNVPAGQKNILPEDYVLDISAMSRENNYMQEYDKLYIKRGIDTYTQAGLAIEIPTTTIPVTTNPMTLADETGKFAQRANLIGFKGLTNISTPVPLAGNAEITNKVTITLGETYIISQILLSNILDSAKVTEPVKFRVCIKNSRLNELHFISFTDLIQVNPLDIESLDYITKTTQLLDPDTNRLYINEPRTIYGNELIGDEIIIYAGGAISQTANFEIYGFQEKDKTKPFYFDKAGILDTAKNTTDANKISVYTDPSNLKGFGSTTNPGAPYVIYSMKLVTTPATITKFKVIFKNSYTNNTMTYNGPVDGQFIYPGNEIILKFTNTLLASQISFVSDANNTFATQVTVTELKGYKASVDDINRFRLEYGVTDIRGSINPDDVCPSLDRFVENQLNSEVIIDAMDYQDKINGEKAKLLSHKDNLLALLEQQSDIDKLGQVVKKIKSVQEKRDNQTNTINALQLQRQMDEYSKLKEVLDERIALRKQNTLDLDINVNKVKYVEEMRGDAGGERGPIQGFTNYKPEDDMRI